MGFDRIGYRLKIENGQRKSETMSILDDIAFVKKSPIVASGHGGASALEKAKTKLLNEIDAQISLARDADFTIKKTTKKRTGEIVETERKLKSWVVAQGDEAFITVRFSNKPMPLGGKRGSVIKCKADEIARMLQKVSEWVQSGEADAMTEKMMKASKRSKKSS